MENLLKTMITVAVLSFLVSGCPSPEAGANDTPSTVQVSSEPTVRGKAEKGGRVEIQKAGPIHTAQGGPPGGGSCGSCSDVSTPDDSVILVHGRNDTKARWDSLVSDWSSRGYTEGTNLFRFDATTDCGDNSYCSQLSGYSGASVNESYALCLKAFIDSHVPTGTVDIVTHSQGAITARYYARFLGADRVDDLVFMSGPNQGTNNCTLAGACTGINPETCPDSDVLRKLNGVSPQGDGSNDETPSDSSTGPIHYSVVVSDKDTVIQGWCSGNLIQNPDQQQSDDVSCKGGSQFTLDTAADRCQISAQHLVIPTDQTAIDFAYCQVNKD